MKILILGSFEDEQTADYIEKTLTDMGNEVMGTNIRRIIKDKGIEPGQQVILNEVAGLKYIPELILVLKGLELTLSTIKSIKKIHTSAKLVNWFFDKYLADKPIWENTSYFDTLREYDYYFCSLKGVADKLVEKGFNNVRFLDEACSEYFHGEVYANSFQQRKYGDDITFIGTIGFTLQHPKRITYLTKLVESGFNLSIYGTSAGDIKQYPKLAHLIKEPLVNQRHSIACNASLINLGIDQDETIESGYSARLFRVLCCKGLYLTNYTKNLEKYFNINLKDQPILETQDLVVYYSEDDMVKKIDYLLEHEDLRNKISDNGQKTVLEKHTFENRLQEMLKIITEETK